jgi:hypothetical protein
MIVHSCRQCPFFQEVPLGKLLEFLAPIKSGLCGYRQADDTLVVVQLGLRPGPQHQEMVTRAKERMPVPDRDRIPDGCPLHRRDIVISLGH